MKSQMQNQEPHAEHHFADFFESLLIWGSIGWPLKCKLMGFFGHMLLTTAPPSCVVLCQGPEVNFPGHPRVTKLFCIGSPLNGSRSSTYCNWLYLQHLCNGGNKIKCYEMVLRVRKMSIALVHFFMGGFAKFLLTWPAEKPQIREALFSFWTASPFPFCLMCKLPGNFVVKTKKNYAVQPQIRRGLLDMFCPCCLPAFHPRLCVQLLRLRASPAIRCLLFISDLTETGQF